MVFRVSRRLRDGLHSTLVRSGIHFIMISAFVNGYKGRKLLPSDLVKSSVDDIDQVQVTFLQDSP
jgi:hypothetical protein